VIVLAREFDAEEFVDALFAEEQTA